MVKKGKKPHNAKKKESCPHLAFIDHEKFNQNFEDGIDHLCYVCQSNDGLRYCLICGHIVCSDHIKGHIFSEKNNSCHSIFMHIKEGLSYQIYCYKCKIYHPSNSFAKFFNSLAKHVNIQVLEGSEKNSKGSHQIGHLSITPKGLQNLGNTCFFNSTVQSLFHTNLFLQLFDIYESRAICNDKLLPEWINLSFESKLNCIDLIQQPLIMSSLKLRNALFSISGNKSINPQELLSTFSKKYPYFERGAQQDSHEFLLLYLNAIKDEEITILESLTKDKNGMVKRSLLDELTITSHIFGGKFISALECLHCLKCDTVVEPFLDVSLPIPKNKSIFASSLPTNKRSKTSSTKAQIPNSNDTLNRNVIKKECNQDIGQPEQNAPNTTTMSKHQLKKIKKENKQARRRKRSSRNASDVGAEDDKTKPQTDSKVLSLLHVNDHQDLDDDVTNIKDDSKTPQPLIAQNSNLDENRSTNGSQPSICFNNNNNNNYDNNNNNDDNDNNNNSRYDINSELINKNTTNETYDNTDKTNVHLIASEIFHDALCVSDIGGDNSDNNQLNQDEGDYSLDQQFNKLHIDDETNSPLIIDDQNYGLYKLLDEFVRPENIPIPKCEHCKTSNVEVEKRMCILDPSPRVLILHLKRFMQSAKSFVKNNADITFPQLLDITRYCRRKQTPPTSAQTKRKNTSCPNSLKSSHYKYQTANHNNCHLYALNAVICHTGSLRNGHYFCYVRQRSPSFPIPQINQSIPQILPNTNKVKSKDALQSLESPIDNENNGSPGSRRPSKDNDSGYVSHVDLHLPTYPPQTENVLLEESKKSSQKASSISQINSPQRDTSSNLSISKGHDFAIETMSENILQLNFADYQENQLYTYLSDTSIRQNMPFNSISSSQAYLLFYERLN